MVEGAPYGREAGYHCAAHLLDRPDRPTALLATSDELAIGALRAAAERGIAVPDGLSVVGFDDAPPAAWTAPALATVRQPHRDKGRAAAEQLLGITAGTGRIFPTELITRASTAPHRTPR